jgi:hypothetical protein
MNIHVHQRLSSLKWREITQWLYAHPDEIRVCDSAGCWVNLYTFGVWARWAESLDDDRAPTANFSIEGGDELIMWFKLKFL